MPCGVRLHRVCPIHWFRKERLHTLPHPGPSRRQATEHSHNIYIRTQKLSSPLLRLNPAAAIWKLFQSLKPGVGQGRWWSTHACGFCCWQGFPIFLISTFYWGAGLQLSFSVPDPHRSSPVTEWTVVSLRCAVWMAQVLEWNVDEVPGVIWFALSGSVYAMVHLRDPGNSA